MMKTNFLTAIAIAVVATLTATAQPQRAQPYSGLNPQEIRQPYRAGGFSMPMGNLDEKQRAELQKIRTEQLKESTQFRSLLREKRAKLETLQIADKPDMREINKLIDEIAAVQAQEMKAQAANRQKIRGLLTDEQRVRFDAMDANREGMRANMRNMRPGIEGMRPGFEGMRSGAGNFRPGLENARPDVRKDRQAPPGGERFRGQRPERPE
jgi:Spy/CpxP family protein refolding chaperone